MSEKRELEDGSARSFGSSSSSSRPGSPILPTNTRTESSWNGLHPALYVATWISLSSAVILFNKWVLHTLEFPFPIFLTTWHMLFATLATQMLAKTTTLLDGRKTVKITGRVYTRAILPIGLFFSLSLICGNKAYLHLSVAFIQMLKATTPVAVLLATWFMRLEKVNYRVLGNVSVIVIGVVIASYGEVAFNTTGVLYQVFGLSFEATRLVLIQKLLSSAEYKMDPLVSLYYYAPVCTVLNLLMYLFTEASELEWVAVQEVGIVLLLANAAVAFALNVSVVFLIGRTSSLVLTLCGVLKDIILVVASMVIWGTTVTLIQIMGYGVALSGLVYYKLGPEVLRERFNVMHSSYSRNPGAVRKSLIAGGSFIIFGLFATAVYSGSGDYSSPPASVSLPPSSVSTLPAATVSGIPGTTVTAYPPLDVTHDVDNLNFTRPFLDSTYTAPRPLDIVVSMYKEDSAILKKALTAFRRTKAFKRLSVPPRVTVYVKDVERDLDEIKKATKADVLKHLPNLGREAATYLHHIVNEWDDLGEHVLFIQAETPDLPHVTKRLNEYFVPETGMLSLGFGHNTCPCDNCVDPSSRGQKWGRIPQIYSAVYGELCPSDQDVLLGFQGQFIVSSKRIRGNTRRVYKHLQDLLEADGDHWIHKDKRLKKVFEDKPSEPYFGHQVERAWMLIFQCADPGLAETCSRLGDGRGKGAGDALDACQCLDKRVDDF